MARLMTDEEAREAFKRDRPTVIHGVEVPTDAWVGPGFIDETEDGRGDDDDD